MPDYFKKLVQHVALPITANHFLLGTDAVKEIGFTVVQGNNMYISIEPEIKEVAKRIFDALA